LSTKRVLQYIASKIVNIDNFRKNAIGNSLIQTYWPNRQIESHTAKLIQYMHHTDKQST